jgi:hypothetical protein
LQADQISYPPIAFGYDQGVIHPVLCMKKVVISIVAAVGLASLLQIYLAYAGYKNGSFELGHAFTLLHNCAYGVMAGADMTIFTILG